MSTSVYPSPAAFRAALSHAEGSLVGIIEPSDHQSLGVLIINKHRRMAVTQTLPGSIQLLPAVTRVEAGTRTQAEAHRLQDKGTPTVTGTAIPDLVRFAFDFELPKPLLPNITAFPQQAAATASQRTRSSEPK